MDASEFLKLFLEREKVDTSNIDPQVSLSANQTEGPFPLNVNFEVDYQLADGAQLSSIIWEFSDGIDNDRLTSTPQTSYVFNQKREYVVRVEVYDDQGRSSSDELVVNVVNPDNLPPIPVAYVPRSSSETASFHVDFHALGSYDPDGEVVEWNWDMGDGTIYQQEVGEHTYEEAGAYKVSLSVTDAQGKTSLALDEVLMTVNCDLAEGPGETCLFIQESPERILPGHLSVMTLETKPAVSWELQKNEDTNVFLESESTGEIVEITDAASFLSNGNVELNTSQVLALVEDFEDVYSLRLTHENDEGEEQSLLLKNIVFGTASLSGTIDPAAGSVEVVESSGRFEISVDVSQSGSFSLEGLPFGQYVVKAQAGELFANESVVLLPFESANLNLSLSDVDTLFTSLAAQKKKKSARSFESAQAWGNKNNKNTNFSIQEIVFAPSEIGSSQKTTSFTVQGTQTDVTLAYRVYALAALSRDVFDISFYYTDENGQAKVLSLNEQTSRLLQGSIFPDQPDPALRSNWFGEKVRLSSIQRNVKVIIRSANLGREDTADPENCQSAVAVSSLAGPVASELSVKRIERVEGTVAPHAPVTQFFPVERDVVRSAIPANPPLKLVNNFHDTMDPDSVEVKEKYKLSWEVSLAQLPDGEEWLPGTEGLKIDLEALQENNPVPELIPLEASEVTDIIENEKIVKKIVSFSVDKFATLEMFDLDPEALENPEQVRFIFRGFTTDGEVSRKGNTHEISLTPFYNAEKLMDRGGLLYGNSVSMYGTWSTYKKVREMKNRITGALYNDISLPFGGTFAPHTSDGHKFGTALDFTYPGGADEERGLNLDTRLRFEFAKKAAKGKTEALERLGEWVVNLRENLSTLDEIDEDASYILDTGASRPSDGRDVIGVGVDWHLNSIVSGELLGKELTSGGATVGPQSSLETDEKYSWERNGEHLGHIHINFGD